MQSLLAPDAWAELKSLFGCMIELDVAVRRNAIELCDPALRAPLLRLIEEYEQSAPFLKSHVLSPGRVLEYLASGCQVFSPGDLAAERYRITRFIGEGGMGEVYEAEDCELPGRVALKTVRPELAANAEIIEGFKREIQLARRVTHPNVCRVYDLEWHRDKEGSGLAFLTMELLDGDTLSQHIANTGAIPEPDAARIAREVALGLDAAHSAGIVHGDLNAANIILVPAGEGRRRAVITDFGLAFEQASSWENLRLAGTPAYIAPEKLNGAPLTFSADVYSFGVLLFEVFTGALPFKGRNSEETARLRLTTSPPSPRSRHTNVSRRWATAILACLAREPEKRPRSAIACVEMAERAVHSGVWLTAAAAVCITGGSAFVLVPHSPPVVDAEAGAHMKRASLFLGRRTDSDVRNAINEYRSVVHRDPRFVPGWLGLSEAYSVSANFHYSDFRSSLASAIRAAETAVRLDSRSGRGYGLLAYCTSIDVHRWLSAEPQFLRALSLDNHDPQVRMWYGSFLGKCGRSNEAIANVKEALEGDPTSLSLNQQLAWEYYRARRIDESLQQARELMTLQPRDPMSFIAVARAYQWKREFAQAMEAVAGIQRYGDPLAAQCLRASIKASSGNAVAARAIATRLKLEWERGNVESVLLAEIYCRTGDKKEAVDLLNAGFERWDPSVLKAAHHPSFDVLREDPAYLSFLSRIGVH